MPSEMSTLLSLPRFAQIVGLHPLHFMQVDANIGSAESRVCIEPIFQYTWQHSDAISREEIAEAIYESENELADYLGFNVMPTWTQEEIQLIDMPYIRGTFWNGNRLITGDVMSIKLNKGHVISGGIRAKTLISAGAAIVYTDVDSDGYKETATITVAAGTITDPGEFACYYPGESGDDEWEIKPISVTFVGANAVIVIKRELLVIKNALLALDAQTMSGGTDANFLTTVDVYRKYHDPSQQVQFVWRNGVGGCSCGEGTCTCSLTIQNGCMTVKDHRLGIVTLEPGDWNADTETFDSTEFTVCRRPDYVRVWYRSGYRDLNRAMPNWQMAHEWEIAVAKLACTKMDRPICSCRSVQQIMERWSINLRASVSTTARTNSYKMTSYEIDNSPFGTTMGAIEVWRLARRRALGV